MRPRRRPGDGLLLGHPGLRVGFVFDAVTLIAGRPLGGGLLLGGGVLLGFVSDAVTRIADRPLGADIAGDSLVVVAVEASPFVFCAVDLAGVVVLVGFAHASCAGGGGGKHCGQ